MSSLSSPSPQPQLFGSPNILTANSDIAAGVKPEEIFAKLQEVWDIPLRRKSKVLALTVPEVGAFGIVKERLDARRNKLNDLIKGYKKEGLSVPPAAADLRTICTDSH